MAESLWNQAFNRPPSGLSLIGTGTDSTLSRHLVRGWSGEPLVKATLLAASRFLIS